MRHADSEHARENGAHISTESMGSKNGTRDMPPTAKARELLEADPDQERA